jgi:hypothetical protein
MASLKKGDWVQVMPLPSSYAWAEPRIGIIDKRYLGYGGPGRWVYDIEVDGEVLPEVAESRIEAAA